MFVRNFFPLSFLFFTAFSLPFGNREELEIEDGPASSNDKSIGQKALDKFDQVFYGLLDEAVQHVTDDKKGAFKDMVLRHREDFVKNLKHNLSGKDEITLDDVKKTVAREMQNRLELFKYIGSSIWNKLGDLSRDLADRYKNHCKNNGSSLICFTGKSKESGGVNQQLKSNRNQGEREFDP